MTEAVPDVLHTVDGVQLAVRRWKSPKAHAAIVLVHGFTGRIDQVTELADELFVRGYDVVAFDSRGHGGSSGYCTLGDLERHDVAAAVAEARRSAEQVVVVGASMGGVATLRYAADDPTLAGVVTVSAPATWQMPRTPRSALAVLLTRTGPGRAFTRRYLGTRVHTKWGDPEPPVDLARRLRVPLGVVHGARDDFVLPENGRLLHAAAPEPHRLWTVPGMGHGFGPRATATVLQAVEWVLSQ